MQTIRIIGEVDHDHRLVATVPLSIQPGSVEVLLITHTDGEDDAGLHWVEGIVREWQGELADTREDIYTLQDGVPADGPR